MSTNHAHFLREEEAAKDPKKVYYPREKARGACGPLSALSVSHTCQAESPPRHLHNRSSLLLTRPDPTRAPTPPSAQLGPRAAAARDEMIRLARDVPPPAPPPSFFETTNRVRRGVATVTAST